MGITLVIALLDATRPPGFLDEIVWPFAYGFAAFCSVALAVKPIRIFLHAWASVIISIGLIRALMLGLEPAVPSLRWASVSTNVFFAALAYVVWAGWKDSLPSDGGEVVTIPVRTLDTLLSQDTGRPGQLTIRDQLDESIRINGEAAGLEPEATPEQSPEYRLPRVPGLS